MTSTIETMLSEDLLEQICLDSQRADSLLGLLAETLAKLQLQDDAPYQLYALGVMAEGASDKLQSILTSALELQRRQPLGTPPEGA